MAKQTQTNAPKKRRGRSREELMAISVNTRWKPGQSGNPRGSLSEKAISEGLRAFYSDNPKEFARLLSAAHRKASAKNPHAKFWELVADRVEGKVASQVDVRATVLHLASESEKKIAQTTIESIRAFESEAKDAINGELCEENQK